MQYLTLCGLDNKHQMPLIGLGAPHAVPKVVEDTVLSALDCEYRHIDTAFMYYNEEAIGNAIRKWISDGKGKREDLFITTKLPMFANRAEDVERYLKMSLERLQLDYVDLYLIHAPLSIISDVCTIESLLKNETNYVFDNNDNVRTWQEMERLVRNGLVRAIGLSNFNTKQISTIYNNCDIKPAVLQIEMHAYLQQMEVVQFCNKHNIAVTAFSPLGRPGSDPMFTSKCITRNNMPFHIEHPVVKEIAARCNKASAQVLLKHLVQQNIAVIPRSCNPQRQKENIDIFDFELSLEDMEKLNDLDQGEDGRCIDFKFLKGAEEHPEYPFIKTK